MNRRHYLLVVALSLVAGLAGHALYGVLLSPQPVEARGALEPRDLQWEYCAVSKAQYAAATPRVIYWINYFRGEGVKVDPVEASLGGNSFAKAVAKLGEDGWEMVGEGPLEANVPVRPGSGANAIFFKRRKD
ncbi:MAG: hypothetical protein QOC99_2572 [Acidobacteriota bacterium]|jgi:hypothetical protein|nr:hypothetical protein [Acidobacteriota bacterium]